MPAKITSTWPFQGAMLLGPLPLLLGVGFLLAVSVLLSKFASGQNAPMLTYLTAAMGGSGLALMLMTRGLRTGQAGVKAIAFYSVGAGGLMALGSAVGYLTVHKVGAAFIVLALAFPPVLTWLLSLCLRMERFDAIRLIGLLISLGGGVLLAISKGISAPTHTGAILIACTMPVILAAGNVFRTRYWPVGASPRELAGAMLMCGALLTMPFAIWLEGALAGLSLLRAPMLVVLMIAFATFVAQYVALFRLQQVAGPVYMSQIGSVAAIFGGPAAVLVFGERLPDNFGLVALLIVSGLSLFQYRNAKSHR